MTRRGWVGDSLIVVVVLAAALMVLPAAGVAAPSQPRLCEVSSGRQFPRAEPAEVGMDPAALTDAVAFAADRNRVNIQIFRRNCLVAEGPRNQETGNLAWNNWSIAKSVTSLVAGLAYDEGRLGLDDPIGKYLAPGLGDAAHRAIKVRHLLTETSGLLSATVSEGASGVVQLDPDVVAQGLGMPFAHQPGSVFEYNQRAVDLLAAVVEIAVGEPFQDYAQRKLFDPLGIERSDYYWARDRSGHTYGFSFLLMPANDLSKLGLLLLGGGSWGGERIVSAEYLRMATTPSPRNPCYGFLFWLQAPGCESASLPTGIFWMSGLGMQNVFVVPNLDLVVVWTGAFGNRSGLGPIGTSQNTSELPHSFFRLLSRAIVDVAVPDPGPYVEPPLQDPDVSDFADASISLAIFGIGPAAYPGCTLFECLGLRLAPPAANWPPGCAIVVCTGTDPRTPGIRPG